LCKNNDGTLCENDGTLVNYTPKTALENRRIRVEVHDVHGKTPVVKDYLFTVQDCGYPYDDLYADIDNKCGTTPMGKHTVFIKDETGSTYTVVEINGRWWFAENLRRGGTGAVPHITSDNNLGYFYKRDPNTFSMICPEGWSLPKEGDWADLPDETTVQFRLLAFGSTGPSPYDGTKWVPYKNVGDDVYRFSAKPAGYYYNSTTPFYQGSSAIFLTDSENNVYYFGDTSGGPAYESMNGSSGLKYVKGDASWENSYYTVRCVRNYP
jgi:uncharacterized protein (TIGR02145 family)